MRVFFSQDFVKSGEKRKTLTQIFTAEDEAEAREAILSFLNEMEEKGYIPVGRPCKKIERS